MRVTLIALSLVLGLTVVLPARGVADTTVPCSGAALVGAINAANGSGGGVLDLTPGCTYSYAVADNTADWPGTALPVISSRLTIDGNGATITRTGSIMMRLIDVGPSGTLHLSQSTLSGGSTFAGNHLHAGGGILDNGVLALAGDTITGNVNDGVVGGPSAVSISLTATDLVDNGDSAPGDGSDGLFTFGAAPVSVNGGSIRGNYGFGVEAQGPVTVGGVTMTGNRGNLSSHTSTTVSDASLKGEAFWQVEGEGPVSITNSTLVSTVGGVVGNGIRLDSVTMHGGGLSSGLTGAVSLDNVTMDDTKYAMVMNSMTDTLTVSNSRISSDGTGVVGMLSEGALRFINSSISGFANAVRDDGDSVIVENSVIMRGAAPSSGTVPNQVTRRPAGSADTPMRPPTGYPLADIGVVSNGGVAVTNSTVAGFVLGIATGTRASSVMATTVTGSSDSGIIGAGAALAVDRSTITGNGHGVVSATTVSGSTVAANTLSGVTQPLSPPTVLSASIVSANGGANCGGPVNDGGHNLSFPSSDTSCPAGMKRADPRLGALRDNGGPTATMALLAGSSAAGMVPVGATDCTPSDTDQRGLPRLQGGQPCDAGAFEIQTTAASTPAAPTPATPSASVPPVPQTGASGVPLPLAPGGLVLAGLALVIAAGPRRRR